MFEGRGAKVTSAPRFLLMRPTIPPAKRQAATKCFEEGQGYKRTARLIGVSEATVRDWKRLWQAHRFALKPAFQYKGKLSGAERQHILALRHTGQTIDAIAKHLGRSNNMVAHFLRQTITGAALSVV